MPWRTILKSFLKIFWILFFAAGLFGSQSFVFITFLTKSRQTLKAIFKN